MKKLLAVVLEMTMNTMAKIISPRKGMARAAIWLAVLCLPDCVALGQVVLSGSAVFSGSSQLLSATGGAPLTYPARTDSCVHGYSTNAPTVAPFYNLAVETCLPGATTGQNGSALVFQEGTSDPVPFKRLDDATTPALANTSFVDPDFGSYSIFATDQSTLSATTKFQMGSDGEQDSFSLGSSADTLLVFGTGGGHTTIVHLVPSRIHAHTCSTSNQCSIVSNVTGANCTPSAAGYTAPFCTHTQISNGGTTFSRNASDPPNTLYELNFPQVYKDTWTSSMTGEFPDGVSDSVTRTLYVDFSSNGGGAIPCSVVPSDYNSTWTGVFNISNNGALTIASGGGGSYQTIGTGAGGAQTITPDTFILPVNNEPAGNFMFQASGGTTSGTEPNWNASCPAIGNTCTDGTVTWTNIGRVGGQGPGFDVVHFDPARGCSRENTRLTKLYRGTNEGPSWPSAGTADPAGQWMTDDATICNRMGGSSCGTGGTVALTDTFTLHEGSQKLQSQYGIMGVTGGGAVNLNFTGAGGNGSLLSATGNGSCTPAIGAQIILGAWISGHTYVTGNYVWDATDSPNHNYYKAKASVTSATPPHSDSTNWQYESSYCYGYVVDWNSNLIRPILELGSSFGGDGHHADGYLYDYRGQKFFTHLFNQPNCQAVSGSCTYIGQPNPGVPTINITLPDDYHPTYRNVGTADAQPFFLPTTDVPSWGGTGLQGVDGGGTGVGAYCCRGYDEIIALSVSAPSTFYRFGHNYNTGSSSLFSAQNAVGVISPDGTMLAWGSDAMNTRGDGVTGSATCASPLRGQYQPSPGGAVTLNDYILPIGSANGANNIFKITNAGTAIEGTVPNWDASCSVIGNVCTDANGVQFANQGPNSCRSDIAVMDVLSAH